MAPISETLEIVRSQIWEQNFGSMDKAVGGTYRFNPRMVRPELGCTAVLVVVFYEDWIHEALAREWVCHARAIFVNWASISRGRKFWFKRS